jgi:hypothetical protein
VPLVRDPDTGQLVKLCPHCRQVSRTLATQCPQCGRFYDGEDRSVIDELPLIDPEMLPWGGTSFTAEALAALANMVIVVVLLPLVLLRHGLRRVVRALRSRAH